MIPILKERFRANIDRARNLVSIYERVAGGIQGRTGVAESDLLRAAVVFLHAALEDLLRGIASWKLPNAQPDVLAQIPFAGGDGRSPKFTLGDLAGHRVKSVDEVISESVMTYLDITSYNETRDIAKCLGQIGCNPTAIKRLMDLHGPLIEIPMSRRHRIAHQLDRNLAAGRGQHRALSLGKGAVQHWIECVVRFSE